MNIIKKYNNALQAIYDHVGFVEDYVIYPIDDQTDSYWDCNGKTIKFADSVDQFNSNGDYYTADVYTQRFYKNHIYTGEKYTMIFGDPHVDGMKYFYIFDNSKRISGSKIESIAEWAMKSFVG